MLKNIIKTVIGAGVIGGAVLFIFSLFKLVSLIPHVSLPLIAIGLVFIFVSYVTGSLLFLLFDIDKE
jgi:hypothetical protein